MGRTLCADPVRVGSDPVRGPYARRVRSCARTLCAQGPDPVRRPCALTLCAHGPDPVRTGSDPVRTGGEKVTFSPRTHESDSCMNGSVPRMHGSGLAHFRFFFETKLAHRSIRQIQNFPAHFELASTGQNKDQKL